MDTRPFDVSYSLNADYLCRNLHITLSACEYKLFVIDLRRLEDVRTDVLTGYISHVNYF